MIEKANSFLEKGEIQGLSSDTARAYAYALMSLFKFVDEDFQKFSDFTQKDLQVWMETMKKVGLKPRSINHRLTVARAFYRFFFDKDIPHASGVLYPHANFRGRRKNPLSYRTPYQPRFLDLKVKIPYKVVDPLQPREIDEFLRSIHRYRDLGITLSMLLCGLRSIEVLRLKLSDINFHQSLLRVSGKGNRERMVPMPFRLMQIFERYMEVERPDKSCESFFVILQSKKRGNPMTRPGLRSIFRYHREKLGISKAKPHQFRHTFASDMARSGVPLTIIQKLLGHSDPKTSMIYIELFLDDIRLEYEKAMKRIEDRYAALKK